MILTFLRSVPTLLLLLVTFTHLLLSVNAQICARGKFNRNTTCELCPPGSFTAKTNATECDPCPAGKFSAILGTQRRENCRGCPANSFSLPGSTSCTPCAEGTLSTPRAARCVTCPPGSTISFYLPASRSRDCDPCNGYVSPDNPLDCVLCPSGTVAKEQATSIADCLPCPQNTSADAPTACVTPTPDPSCSPGFRLNDDPYAGSYTPRCIRCKNGTTTKVATTDICRRIGAPCPPTHIENSVGDCVRCRTDTFYDVSTGTCRACPPGQGSAPGLPLNCVPCTEIRKSKLFESRCYFAKGATRTSANGECLPGSYVAVAGEYCRRCTPGSYSNASSTEKVFNAAFGRSGCPPCPPGTVQPNYGGTNCTACGAGTIPNENSMKCVIAESGCRAGFSLKDISENFADCFSDSCDGAVPDVSAFRGRLCGVCGTGQFYKRKGTCGICKADELGDGKRCAKCAEGLVRYNDVCSCRGPIAENYGTVNGRCQMCPTGWYGMGVTNDYNEVAGDNVCRKCPAGTFRVVASEESLVGCTTSPRCPPPKPCRNCAAGWFSDAEGATECKPCAAGTFTYGIGETECQRIDATSRPVAFTEALPYDEEDGYVGMTSVEPSVWAVNEYGDMKAEGKMESEAMSSAEPKVSREFADVD